MRYIYLILFAIIGIFFAGPVCFRNIPAAEIAVPSSQKSDEDFLQKNASRFHDIVFTSMKPTSYQIVDGVLHANVDESSSAYVVPLEEQIDVKSVRFWWKMKGRFNKPPTEELKEKSGDDAMLRVGLIVAGSPILAPTFLPAWIRKTQGILTFSAGSMINLVPNSTFKASETWPSPYSETITNIAVGSTKVTKTWFESTHTFAEPVKVVGLWLMADGDDTKSKYVAYLKNLVITADKK